MSAVSQWERWTCLPLNLLFFTFGLQLFLGIDTHGGGNGHGGEAKASGECLNGAGHHAQALTIPWSETFPPWWGPAKRLIITLLARNCAKNNGIYITTNRHVMVKIIKIHMPLLKMWSIMLITNWCSILNISASDSYTNFALNIHWNFNLMIIPPLDACQSPRPRHC